MGTSKILIDGVGIDLTQDTVAANKMLSGTKAHDSNGDSVTGSIASKAAATYTPTTTDQTIAAEQYLAGAQTVKGDANLVATNIKQGVSIFGVNGNLTPGITPSGTKNIAENGSYDVTQFASAAVNVPVGELNAKRFEITLSADVMNKGTALITDAFLRDMRNMPYATVVLVPHTNNLVVGDATNYIGFSLTSNKNLMDSGSSLKGVSTLAGSYRSSTPLTYGLNQQYGSAASSGTYGHLYIDESGALSAQVSSTYAIGAGDYTIFAFY